MIAGLLLVIAAFGKFAVSFFGGCLYDLLYIVMLGIGLPFYCCYMVLGWIPVDCVGLCFCWWCLLFPFGLGVRVVVSICLWLLWLIRIAVSDALWLCWFIVAFDYWLFGAVVFVVIVD